MKTEIVILLILVFLCSCGTSGRKNEGHNNRIKKHLFVVENEDEYNVAYTEEGHTMIYLNDSVGNNIVYFVKFENGAGKYGLKGIEEKIIRVELDSSFTQLKSFLCVTGGTFLETDGSHALRAYFFDEQLNVDSLEIINVLENHILPDNSNEMEDNIGMKRIVDFLNNAYSIAHTISEQKVRGWDNIAYALESVKTLQDYDVIMSNDIYDEKVKKRTPRVLGMNEELTSLNIFMREKLNNKYEH